MTIQPLRADEKWGVQSRSVGIARESESLP